MTENLVNMLVGFMQGINKNLIIFFISLMPILELRGGLIAAALLNLNFYSSFLICYIGNILPVPLILLFIEKIFALLKKWNPTRNIIEKIEKKSISKGDNIRKYKYLGLLLFVGIPLPGTGAWTGSLLAVLLGLDKKKSFWTITLGVFIAGVIMSILSYGLLKNIF